MPVQTAKRQGNMIIIREPAGKVVKSGSSRALANLRRETADRLATIRSRAATAAREDSDVMVTWGSGAALALAEKYVPDMVSKLAIGPLPASATLATILYTLARKGVAVRYTRTAAAGLGAIAAYQLTSGVVSGVGSAPRFPQPEVLAYVQAA